MCIPIHNRRSICMYRTFGVLFVIAVILSSCKDNVPFDKDGWTLRGDLASYPNREKMIEDLTEEHVLKGLAFSQLIDKLGPADRYSAGYSILTYDIRTDYGHDIDPVYSKSLIFWFDKDSIITDFRIEETNH